MKNHYKVLVALSILSFLILRYRIHITNNFFYLFLVWNLFLAYVPLVISTFLEKKRYTKFIILPMLLVWLAFLPNAPYIITDLMHLAKRSSMTIWYDSLLIMSFASAGMLAYFLSIKQMYSVLIVAFKLKHSRFIFILIAFLNGFGIYLGRFSRWNSWDILQKPKTLFSEISLYIMHPIAHQNIWIFTLVMGSLLAIGTYAVLNNARAELPFQYK
jgi:uncharacterized membrane protein